MRTFIGFGQVPYIGQPQAFPTKLAGIAGVVVPLLFQWSAYGASTARSNINVGIDLRRKECDKLDQIRSIYIDNLGSDNPIYVYFPDTNYTVVAKPNSEGWYPAQTNQKVLWVIGEGFLTGDIPQTFVQISNIPLIPSVNVEIDQSVALWRGSPTITRGTTIYSSNFGIPALGDQFFSSSVLGLTGAGTVPLWNTPYASGFLYITSVQLIAFNLSISAAPNTGNVVIESTGIAGTLINIPTNNSPNGLQTFFQAENLQIKLDATQTWRARVSSPIGNGSGEIISSFTQQP